jgi:hypothetical protein
MGIRSLLSGEWIRERVRASADYKSAVDFSHEYQPKVEKDYAWVLAHALKEYERTSARVDGLDAKADALIGYLGAGSGIISLAMAYGFGSHTTSIFWVSVPSLALLLAAMLCALSCRAPAKLPALPVTKDALEEADKLSSGAEGKFAAMIYMSSAALSLAAREKAKIVRISFWLFGSAVAWLVLSAVATRFCSGQ